MPWLELSLSVDRSVVPAAEAALEAAGALSITLQDHADHPVLEPGPGTTPLWPVVQVRGLFEHTVDRVAIVRVLEEMLEMNQPGCINWLEVGDRDWERAWMDRFRPMKFGRRLWVVPGGMAVPPAPANIEILLDPGLAFGTGTHPTTAMCLQWLDAQDLAGKRVVDYGCGSGILAIASALLGAAEIIAVDNDPQALEATAANAARNAVGEKIAGCSPDEFSTTSADLVLANILAGPLVELAPVLVGCAAPGGRIILSGLLEEQLDWVAAAYGPACEVNGSATLEGWARLDLRRNP